MTISNISSNNSYPCDSSQSRVKQFQTIKQDFQQLSQDLQAGNLTQAQQDFTTLTQNMPNGAPSNTAVGQDLTKLGQALQTGNLTDAQQAFATVQQDVQQAGGHHHHHHHHDAGSSDSGPASGTSNPFAQDFSALGQTLQSGDLAGAQQAYATLQQDLQQGSASSWSGSNSSSSQPTTDALLNVAA